MWWYVVSFFQICYIKVFTDPLVDNSSSAKSVALAELEFKSIFTQLSCLCLTTITSRSSTKRRRSSLSQNTCRNILHLLACVLLSSSAYFCHPIAISSNLLPRLFNLTSFTANTEFIFVSQTFLGWGLLGNGCMKDVSRARRDVWLWKRDKNSQKPKIGFLFHKMLMMKGLILLIFRYLLSSFTVTVVWFHLSLSLFCHLCQDVRVGWATAESSTSHLASLYLTPVVTQPITSKHTCNDGKSVSAVRYYLAMNNTCK